jgi:hypothetical protein
MTARILIAFVCTVGALAPANAQRATTPSPGSRLFAMRSHFWVNLHHFLYVRARAAKGLDAERQSVTRSLADTGGIGRLNTEQRRAWDASLDYYTRVLADRDILFDSAMVVTNMRLSDLDERGSPRDAGFDPEHGRALERAAAAYRAVWWARHDSANKAWIAAVVPMLAQHGDSAAARITRAFDTTWPTTPVRVDVSAYANWAGAYTVTDPNIITISSLNPDNHGTAAFEMLFHEVLHVMDRPLLERLRESARAQGKRLPRGPTHAFIFYSAGEITRRFYPSHVPYAESGGLWTRSRDMGPMLPLLQRHWRPWLDDEISLSEAVRRIVAEL